MRSDLLTVMHAKGASRRFDPGAEVADDEISQISANPRYSSRSDRSGLEHSWSAGELRLDDAVLLADLDHRSLRLDAVPQPPLLTAKSARKTMVICSLT